MTLDYGIPDAAGRLAYVKKLVATHPRRFGTAQLEKMASYILYGYDENGQNAFMRGEVVDDMTRKYRNWVRKGLRNTVSLEEYLENPNNPDAAVYSLDQNLHNKVASDPITNQDIETVPGLKECRELIRSLEDRLGSDTELGAYQIYALRHWIVDLRKYQYTLRDAVRPTMKMRVPIRSPFSQPIDFDSDSAYYLTPEEFERKQNAELLPRERDSTPDPETGLCRWVVSRQAFDWTNGRHVRALAQFYSAIKQENWDRFDSWGKTLILDFDRYFDMCQFAPHDQYIMLRYIDGAKNDVIAQELADQFGKVYRPGTIFLHIARMCECMAIRAQMQVLERETPNSQKVKCCVCGNRYPLHYLFFTRNFIAGRTRNNICLFCKKDNYKRIRPHGNNF